MKKKRRTETHPAAARIARRSDRQGSFRKEDGAGDHPVTHAGRATGRRGWLPAGTTGTKKAVTCRHGS
ncbi:hypothetical protein BSLA_02f3702 [Burkholderia stabilis]|nr:hypothetical protein BSLA_02f3702 [Burkholderia stabilis]